MVFVLVFSIHLSAQDNSNSDDTVFVIREIEFDVSGRSKPQFLMIHGEFEEGERIRGQENFDSYIALRIQLLNNQRVLDQSFTRIDYSLGEQEADGDVPVKLRVYVKDSNNFIILPYPEYSSSDGLSITMELKDYNFFGTMSTFSLDLGYHLDTQDVSSYRFSFDMNLPFNAAGFLWNLYVENNFEYTNNEPLFYRSVTGISVQVPWYSSLFSIGINQYLTFNDEWSTEAHDIYRDFAKNPEKYLDPFGSTEFFVDWHLPLGVEIGSFGMLVYNFHSGFMINYPLGDMDPTRKPVTTFGNSLGFGRINWMGNLRKGLTVSFGVSNDLYFERQDAPHRISLEGIAVFHHPFTGFLGFSSIIRYQQWWQWSDLLGDHIPYYSAGEFIRGVPDDDLRANQMLSLSIDLPIKIINFIPSVWFKKDQFRIFDCEVYFSPFVDLALLKGPLSQLKEDPWEGINFSFKDIISTTGFEVIAFSHRYRSISLRGSVGYNIGKMINEGLPSLILGFFPKWDEIYIGLSLAY